MRRMSSELATLVAAALIGIWLALFFLGATGSGLIHLMPLGAVALLVRGARRSAAHDEKENAP